MTLEKIALMPATAEGVGMCSGGHSLGRGDAFVITKARHLLSVRCIKLCLSTPESIENIRRDFADASRDLSASLDLDGAMHELGTIYKQITRKDMPSKDRA